MTESDVTHAKRIEQFACTAATSEAKWVEERSDVSRVDGGTGGRRYIIRRMCTCILVERSRFWPGHSLPQ